MKVTDASIARALAAARRHLDTRLALVSKGSVDRAGAVGALGLLLNAQAPDSLDDDVVHPYLMALEHARASEVQGAGSLRACVVYAERMARGALPAPHSVSGRAFTASDVPRVVEGTLDEGDVAALARFVAEAGASRYVVEKTPSRFDSVEFVDSYEFKHGSKPVDSVVVMDGARVLVADGYVETVAEIHGVLDRCGRAGERLIICARGFSDDVQHTLAVNRARGTLAAYGLTFAFDADDANTLVDVATIVGGDVVSSLKGQLFSTVDAQALPRVQYARLRGSTLDFRGDGSQTRVARVLASVQEKAAAADDQVKVILEKRIRRLMGACMIVRLKDGFDHLSRVEAWDTAMRSLRAATRGVVDVEDEEAWPGRRVVPLASVAMAHEMAKKLLATLRSLHSFV